MDGLHLLLPRLLVKIILEKIGNGLFMVQFSIPDAIECFIVRCVILLLMMNVAIRRMVPLKMILQIISIGIPEIVMPKPVVV